MKLEMTFEIDFGKIREIFKNEILDLENYKKLTKNYNGAISGTNLKTLADAIVSCQTHNGDEHELISNMKLISMRLS